MTLLKTIQLRSCIPVILSASIATAFSEIWQHREWRHLSYQYAFCIITFYQMMILEIF